CYNDPVAIGAVKAILDAGLRVPNDIAVTGSGNIHFSDLLAVPLTTVDQGTRKIGKTAAEILLRQISSKRTLAPTRILIKPKLVVRQSTLRAAPQPAKLASKTRRKLRRTAK
ncbi:MAG: substrate-binding domain-containing protein, partial [Candidatus Acidiferrales bacterium]